MNTLQLSIYAMAVGLCAFTALLAWRASFRNRFFLVFMTLLVLMLACDWLIHHPSTPLKSLWLVILMASALLVGPCALLLAKSIASSDLRIEWRWHVALVAIAWLLLAPLATAIHFGTEFTNADIPASKAYAFFIHSCMLLAISLFLFQTLWVLRTCCALLHRRNQQNRWLLSVVGDPGLNILRILVLAIFTNAFISIIKVLYCAILDEVHMPLNILISSTQLMMAIFLASAYITQVVNTHSNTDTIREALFKNEFDDACQRPAKTSKTYSPMASTAILNFSKKQQALLQQVRTAIDSEHLYQQPGLSLRDLCDHLDESPHNLSQVINESDLGSFYDMVNSRRVALATSLLKKYPQRTVLDIAFECGFNSKSSFNSVFKRYTGATPSQYRAQATQINA